MASIQVLRHMVLSTIVMQDQTVWHLTQVRVFKGKKMPGHMGHVQITIQNLEVVKIDVENNVILVKDPFQDLRSH